jgi:acetate kinase
MIRSTKKRRSKKAILAPKPANPQILTINDGSSSIEFELFTVDDSLRRIVEGAIERIGPPEVAMRVKGLNPAQMQLAEKKYYYS